MLDAHLVERWRVFNNLFERRKAEYQKGAKEKFQSVQSAYENIKKKRYFS